MTESKTKELERVCLASLIQHNEVIPDLIGIARAEHFSEKLHQALFSLIVSQYQERGIVDEILLVTKAKSIGIDTINDYNVADYVLEVLKYMAVNKGEINNYFKELIGFHIKRRTYNALGECQKFIKNNLSKPLNDILPEIRKNVEIAVNLDGDDAVQFRDVFGEMEQVCKDRAESDENYTIVSGHELFDRRWGGFRPGSLTIFAAQYKCGKSTWLFQLAKNVASIKKNNCKVLIIDTEMSSEEIMFRGACALSGVPEAYFHKGTYTERTDFITKSEHAWDSSRKLAGRVTHAFVLDQDFVKVESTIRQWYYKNINEGDYALVIVDYLKLGDAEFQNLQEFQQVGLKTNALKKLSASLPRCAVISAVQTSQNAQGVENVSMSNRVKWFSSMVFLLARKNDDDRARDGDRFGTHKLVPLATRYVEDNNFKDSLKCQVGENKFKWVPNYINYEFKDFVVKERGCLEDSFNSTAGQLEAENTEDPYEDVKF